MRILFLCHRLPYPPKRGGKIRPFNMIRHLGRRHEVTVATIARTAAEMAEGRGLREHCHDLHVGRVSPLAGWARFALYGATPYPSTFAYFYSPSLDRTVRARLAADDFDAVVVHCSSMGPYVAEHQGGRRIMDFGDADSEKWLEYARQAPFPLSAAFRSEGRKVRRYERWLAERFDACSVTAPREREVMASYIRAPLHVFPNGVDLAYFKPTGPRPVQARIIFTGNMSYRPNVEAVRHFVNAIFPRILARHRDAHVYIVGMDPAAPVRRLADGDRIVVTGRVDDVRPFFESAAVAIAPLRVARGLQNKVLEAMAMQVPVVASSAAFSGIQAVAGRDILVADDPGSFADAVASVLRSPAERAARAAAARACVERNHDWDRILCGFDDLISGPARGETREAALPARSAP